jgi:phosphoribosylformylglycinamidine cyclo-ligase
MVAIVAAGDADAVIDRLQADGESARIIGSIENGARGCTVTGPAHGWGSADAWTASHDA